MSTSARLLAVGALLAGALTTGTAHAAPATDDDPTGATVVVGPTSTLETESTTTSTATCPEGAVATGGGYRLTEPLSDLQDTPLSTITASHPTDDATGWTVTALGADAVAYALCAPTADENAPTVVTGEPGTQDYDGFSHSTATCPTGTRVTGRGYRLQEPDSTYSGIPEFAVASDHPTEDTTGWTVTALWANAVTYTLCGPADADRTLSLVLGEDEELDEIDQENGLSRNTAACPEDTTFVTGGYHLEEPRTGFSGLPLYAVVAEHPTPTGDGWSVTSQRATTHTYALCTTT
ncbi:hypothetical protein [Streptomyces clavuligerus]|nr:hypothetical protein [Streptomyces clavuligerus]